MSSDGVDWAFGLLVDFVDSLHIGGIFILDSLFLFWCTGIGLGLPYTILH